MPSYNPLAMRFAPGTQLGTYELVSELGAGGMGEVYRARDTTLLREVAIKFVNPSLCADPDGLARLRNEARALAALNHPHVATLHELAEFEGFCGLVMELVDGETLAERITRGRLSISEALRIGAQIAAALEAAHDRGLIHRDLKPANIKLTSEGSAKVLDFGLAKAEVTGRDTNTEAPLTRLATGTGVVIGTAGYMSPEQARGAAVDRRTDVWALGCVLFEMITGRRAFDGPTATDTLVAILEREPDWALLPANTPPVIRRLLRRCLEKELRRRLRDVGDARLELEDAAIPTGSVEPVLGTSAPRRSFRWILGLTAVLGVAAVASALMLFFRADEPRVGGEVQFAVTLPAGERLGATDFPALAISPDGRFIAYVVTRGVTTQLVLRRLNELTAASIAGTSNATSPFFSPDSQWIGFFADGALKKVPLAGGPPITICAADSGFGGTWSVDDSIIFADATGSGLWRVASRGGSPSPATKLEAQRGEFSHRWPEVLPDGKTVLFTVGTVGEWDEAEIAAQALDGDRREIVIKGGTHPHYLASGHLLYLHAGAVWIAPFDLRQLKTTGPPARALEGVIASADGAGQFAVSPAGTIVYAPADAESSGRRLVTIDAGGETPLAAPPRSYIAPRVSPNGRQVVVGIADRAEHVWLYDLSAGTLKQLTFDGANRTPIWTADGERVTFSSNRNGPLNLFTVPIDGSRTPERLTTSEYLQIPGSWSPDGTTLAFVEQRPASGRDIWLLGSSSQPIPWANSAADESSPRFSPDGRVIAYVSDVSGRAEVYVRGRNAAVPGHLISTQGGMEPVWARDGRTLFYRASERIMSVAILGTEPLRIGPRGEAFAGPVQPGTFDTANYDVLTSTGRFVTVAGPASSPPAEGFRVVVNWNPFSGLSP